MAGTFLSVDTKRLAKTARLSAVVLATYSLVGGIVSFCGWVLGVQRLTDWLGNGISILPNACVATACIGGGLLLTQRSRRVAAALSVFAGVLAAVSLFQNVAAIDLGINTLLTFGHDWGSRGALFPGLVGVPGSLSFLCLAAAILLISIGGERSRPATVWLILVPLVLSMLSLVGFFFGSVPMTDIPRLTAIAMQTATFIFAASLSAIILQRESWPMLLLLDEGPAGMLVRRVVPAVIVLPLLLGFLRISGERAGMYGLEFGTAARTIAEVLLLLALLFWTASIIADAARRRNEAVAALSDSEQQLRSARDYLEDRVVERTRELEQAHTALIEEKEERVGEQRERIELLRRLITGQEAERQRIGRDIHDHLGQRLTAVRLQLESLKNAMAQDPTGKTAEFRLQSLDELARILDAEVSYLAWELRPTVLDQFGLVETLRLFVQEWSRQFGIDADFQTLKLGTTTIDQETETHLYRITQEALNNIAKHADALNVTVQLTRHENKLSLIIEDNGRGFNVNGGQKRSPLGGFGLTGMRERAELIGAELEIESRPGKGTTVFVRVAETSRADSVPTNEVLH